MGFHTKKLIDRGHKIVEEVFGEDSDALNEYLEPVLIRNSRQKGLVEEEWDGYTENDLETEAELITQLIAREANRVHILSLRAINYPKGSREIIDATVELGKQVTKYINECEKKGIKWRQDFHDYQHSIGHTLPRNKETTTTFDNVRSRMECTTDESVQKSIELTKQNTELLAKQFEREATQLHRELLRRCETRDLEGAAEYLKEIAILGTCVGPVNKSEISPGVRNQYHAYKCIQKRKRKLEEFCKYLGLEPSVASYTVCR